MQNIRATQELDNFEHTSKTDHVVRSHMVRMQDWPGETDVKLTLTRNTMTLLRIIKK